MTGSGVVVGGVLGKGRYVLGRGMKLGFDRGAFDIYHSSGHYFYWKIILGGKCEAQKVEMRPACSPARRGCLRRVTYKYRILVI